MRSGTWIGMNEAIKELDRLPTRIKKSNINAAAAKALQPVKRDAKSGFRKRARKNSNEVSKARWLDKATKITRFKKTKVFGALVHLKGPKIPGIPWELWQYARLFAFGAKGERFTRGSKAKRGRFKGFEDPIAEAGFKWEGSLRRNFTKVLLDKMDKAIKKTNVR
jgi:hypothetical protein